MSRIMKAAGYICDIPVQDTDVVIKKDDQRIRILKYAQQHNLELVAMFEDDDCSEDFMNRPGVKKMLDSKERFDVILVERVWALSRKMNLIKPFLDRLSTRNMKLVASSYLWDIVSQQVRQCFTPGLGQIVRREARAKAAQKGSKEAA